MNEEESLRSKVAGSLAWKFFERGGVQITQFIVSIVIARLLSPEAYGPIVLLTVFISIASIFVQSGLGIALIQKKDADEIDYSSVLYYSLFIATILYIILFFSAKPIADFYKMPEIVPTLRVLALTLFPGALNLVQIAVLSKRMQFKKQFYSNMVAATLSGILGITAAIIGFGTWALVFQQLFYQVLICVVLWFLVRWRPSLHFSFRKTKSLLKYGIRLLGANLIDTIYHNLESLVIGKKYSGEILAYFNKGKQFPLVMIDNIDGSLQSVMVSAYSLKQDEIENLKKMIRRTVSLSTYLVFPAMIGLAVVGNPLISLVLGNKWINCVPFLQLYCFIAMLFPLQTTNLQAINAIGRSDIYLKLMAIKRSFGVMMLIIAVFCFESVFAIVYACLITEVISIIINFIPNGRLFHYTGWEQMKDVFPNLIISILMGILVYCINYIPLNHFLVLLLQCFCGFILYVLFSAITKNQSFIYIIKFAKKKWKEKCSTKKTYL
jgi:O-antigen/teichoic acid export membrane protein